MMTRYINGKFIAQRLTGVQRVAMGLVRSLDEQSGDELGCRWILLCPPGAQNLQLKHIEQRQVGWLGMPLHLWEQLVLPRAAHDGLLINLSGSAPMRARRQIAVLHDAAIFDHPEAYTRAFLWWYRRLFRRLAREGTQLLTVSNFSRSRLAVGLRVPTARIGLLPNGCDHLDPVVADATVLWRHGLQSGRFLLAVASGNATKNLAGLVQAFGQLKHDAGLQLAIVGGANQRVFACDESHASLPGVCHLGYQDDASLKALYQHALAMVFPSLYEGFGLPPLEAMACGCPVAAAQVASIPEVCGDAVLYFDPRSVDAMAEALHRLCSDESLRERLRNAGAVRVCTYRWSRSASILRACIAHLEGLA